MNRNELRTYLLAASYLATKLGEEFTKDSLSFEFRYDIELNQSCDDPSDQKFVTYPDDDGRTVTGQSIENAVAILSRGGRVPVWIDINVKSWTRKDTVLQLCCSGRYTEQAEEMYYNDRGLGPFGIKSPNLRGRSGDRH